MKTGASVQYGIGNLAITAGAQEDGGTEEVDPVAAAASRQNFSCYKPRRKAAEAKPGNSAASGCERCGYEHRNKYCPASKETCHSCGEIGHFRSMCRKKSRDKGKLVTGAVVAATSNHVTQPIVTVDINAGGAGKTKVAAVADTRAKVCVAGPRLMQALGLRRARLAKCDNIRDVAGRTIEVYGRYHCQISLNGEHSYQSIYFVPSAGRCFLSLAACKELKLVHESFPKQLPMVGSVRGNPISLAPSPARVTEDSPRRLAPVTQVTSEELPQQPATTHSRPTEVPMPPMEENIERMQEWFLQRFSGTTFNVDRDMLPIMEGEPHHIHLKEDAVPYACHTPADVAKHWENEVKQKMDKDVV